MLFFFISLSSRIECSVYVRSSRAFQLLLRPKWPFFVIIIFFLSLPHLWTGGTREQVFGMTTALYHARFDTLQIVLQVLVNLSEGTRESRENYEATRRIMGDTVSWQERPVNTISESQKKKSKITCLILWCFV